MAFEAFFSGMPTHTQPGMAFVLVQHLAPDHSSMLTALMQRNTPMHVLEVEDGMVVQVNFVEITEIVRTREALRKANALLRLTSSAALDATGAPQQHLLIRPCEVLRQC